MGRVRQEEERWIWGGRDGRGEAEPWCSPGENPPRRERGGGGAGGRRKGEEGVHRGGGEGMCGLNELPTGWIRGVGLGICWTCQAKRTTDRKSVV